MKKPKDILLCDLDAFFASVEQRDRPELKGKPVIVGGSPEGRGVVSTCSYEARVFGVRSAMPMKKAVSLCPEAVVLRGCMSHYASVSGQVREIFNSFTPEVELVSIDEAYLAVPQGEGLSIGEAVHDRVKEIVGLPISVGVSSNKLLAKIACEMAKPDRIKGIWPDEVPELLWPQPVRILPGIGPATENILKRHGIVTVCNLAACPVETLVRMLGKNAVQLYGFAHGQDNRELELDHETKSVSEETTFAEDIYEREAARAAMLSLSAGVGYRLRRSGWRSRTITVKIRFSDFRTITRGKSLSEAVDSDNEIFRLAMELFEKHCSKGPWRLIGVQASSLEEEGQLSLFPPTETEEKDKRLTMTRDQLRNKYGKEVLFQAGRLRIFKKK